MSNSRGLTKLTITAIFIALIIIQTFIPNIGYVRILPTLPAITTIPLTIAIYGTLMGARWGLAFGLIWGITRLIVAYTQPGDMVSMLLFQNPLIALIPSIMAGFIPGIISTKVKDKNNKVKKTGYILSGAMASLANTILVILMTSLVFMNNSTVLTTYLGHFNNSTPLIMILLMLLGVNGITEAIFTAVITPIIVTPLSYVLKRAV